MALHHIKTLNAAYNNSPLGDQLIERFRVDLLAMKPESYFKMYTTYIDYISKEPDVFLAHCNDPRTEGAQKFFNGFSNFDIICIIAKISMSSAHTSQYYNASHLKDRLLERVNEIPAFEIRNLV